MRRAALMVVLWIGATGVTGALAWSAVQVAGAQAAPDPVRPLSAAEVQQLPVASSAATVATAPPSTPAVGVTVPPGTAASTAATSITAATVVTPPSTTSATVAAAPAASEPTTPATTAVPTTTAPAPETHAIHLVGGSIGVRVQGDSVTLAWATPNSGFRVEVDNSGPDEVAVEFQSDNHESKVTVGLEDGRLHVDEAEEARSEDDGEEEDDESREEEDD